ncbi:hypothetical protein T265_06785 [Opisthorchis viverrini]|uniref:Uncharacterized protein n=1 Tax=Opisthorchis viverrini TaxID=6198 RepID=A0A074ZRA5_OPIVI|nr:hypothetical protein T265_06785 [Opisthorchis viverrini]KER25875.1 hypothetical protein T265_06785 [Opisthorchis viverrini]
MSVNPTGEFAPGDVFPLFILARGYANECRPLKFDTLAIRISTSGLAIGSREDTEEFITAGACG